jgi:hypothetical protein
MSYRISQLSPQTSTRGSGIRVLVNHEGNSRLDGLRNMQFLRSWFEYDSQAIRAKRGKHLNWNAVWGLGIMVGVSAGFWSGVALVLSRMAR